MEDQEICIPIVLNRAAPLHQIEVAALKETITPNPKTTMMSGTVIGRQQHPISFENCVQTMFAVSTQMTCILTKRDATVGLGFESQEQRDKRREERQAAMMPPPADPKQAVAAAKALIEDTEEKGKAEEVLDPLCRVSWQHLMNLVGEDYENTGNGYFEVVREEEATGKVAALYHYFSPTVYVFNEGDEDGNFHFEVEGQNGTMKFARFGDVEGFRQRNPDVAQERVTEMVPFNAPTASCESYGLPSWLAGIPWLEMAQHLMSFESDYFQNRAVPDLLVFITGKQISKDQWEAITKQIKNLTGHGNRHKTLALNIPGEVNIQIERLTQEDREKIGDSWSTVAMEIVSAHRMPPLLAGITVPGKMAAANELPNALVAFQTLYVAQQQKLFQHVLGQTLGSEEAGLGLKPTDFLLRRITDYYDMGQMDTMSRMKQPVSGSNRDLKQGLKD